MEEVSRGVSHLLEQPALNTYALLKRHASLLAIISRQDFRHLFLMRDSRLFRRAIALEWLLKTLSQRRGISQSVSHCASDDGDVRDVRDGSEGGN